MTPKKYRQRRPYIAGPYRADTPWKIQLNIRNAAEVNLALHKMGLAPFCPHMNSALFDGECPDSVFLKAAMTHLEAADFVVLVHGWENSSGTLAEVKHALELGLPVYVWDYSDGTFLNNQITRLP